MPRANHLEDFLLAIRGQSIDFHRASNHEIERLGWLALAKQWLALVDVEQLTAGEQLIELLIVQRLEQVVAAQNLVMDAVTHHGNSS
ncbi:hypothetical protein D3C80_1475620 [compost metagenome]